MSTQPSIIITRLDLQRLERLLDELEDFGPAPRRWSGSSLAPRWWATRRYRRA